MRWKDIEATAGSTQEKLEEGDGSDRGMLEITCLVRNFHYGGWGDAQSVKC